jgi:poly(3-hydroxyalkanoate) synthetase
MPESTARHFPNAGHWSGPPAAPKKAVRRTARQRTGPRPFLLHLAQARNAWLATAPEKVAAFLEGVRRYRAHPYRREMARPKAAWRSGAVSLLDYGPLDGYPLLVVPSLINRAYVLDLKADASLIRYLAQQGLRPFLLDWGDGSAGMRRLTLDEHVLQILLPAFEWLARTAGRRPLLLGYCMGGLLALALASWRPDRLAGLALLATPWDFAEGGDAGRRLAAAAPLLTTLAGSMGGLAVDQLQALFAGVDPLQVPGKFGRFASAPAAAAERFVAIEDWLNDGVPLGGEVVRSCLEDWYRDNLPGRGEWRVGARPIRPERLDLPACIAVPARDRIVPAESALALAARLAHVAVLRPEAGHISMVAGAQAENRLWAPLGDWLLRIAAMQKKSWRGGYSPPIL